MEILEQYGIIRDILWWQILFSYPSYRVRILLLKEPLEKMQLCYIIEGNLTTYEKYVLVEF